MIDPTILFVKPKAISGTDKKALRMAGVIVVEVEDPQSVRLMKATTELDGSDLLRAAAKAIYDHSSSSEGVRSLFGRAISSAIMSKASPS